MKVLKGMGYAPQNATVVAQIEGNCEEFVFTKEDFKKLKKLGLIPSGARYKNYWYSNGIISNVKTSSILIICN